MELNKEYSYGELTRGILGEEPKKGGSKTKQMKQIESLYKVDQKGRKYILVEKFEEQKEIIDNRKNNGGNNTSKYSEELYPLIKAICYSKIDKSDSPTVYLTTTQVLKDYFRSNSICLEIYNEVINGNDTSRNVAQKRAVVDYIQQYRTKVMSRFNTQLKTLTNECYILCEFNIVRGKLWNGNYQNLNPKEKGRYVTLQNSILEVMSENKGYKVTINKLSKLGLRREFNKMLRDLMEDDELLKKYRYVFKSIAITPSDQFVEFALEMNEEFNLLKGYFDKAESEDVKTMAKDVKKYTQYRVNNTNEYNMNNSDLSIDEILHNIWKEEKGARGLYGRKTKDTIRKYVLSKDLSEGSEEDRIKHYYYHKERSMFNFEEKDVNDYSTEYKTMIDKNYDGIVDRICQIADELDKNEDLCNDLDSEDISLK